MKNSALTIFALVAFMACKKTETTAVNRSTDSTVISTPVDSPMKVNDSTKVTTPSSANSLSEQDKKFADAAAKGGLMEVMMGKLAATNATGATVKTLGEMMVKDHSKANDELKKWASTVGYTLPTGLDAEKQKKYDDLKAKKGTEFDRMYTDLMVSDHKKDIEEFKKEGSDGKEASLKSFANNTLPTLEHHLMESEKAKKTVK
jgi:putative membrane protein